MEKSEWENIFKYDDPYLYCITIIFEYNLNCL